MRYLMSDDSVEEVVSLDATSGWEHGADTNDTPTMYSVSIRMFMADKLDFMYVGEYILDGTKETYEAAVKNFTAIVKHATEKGWFSAEMFENFEWW